jgi:hypothetical protein
MKYDETNLRLARKVFNSPVQEGLYYTKCKLCGETVIEGSRYRDESVDDAMHHDCFYVTIPDRTPKFDMLDYLLKIGESKNPKIILKKPLLEKLVDKSVELFPFQHNFFFFGSCSEDEMTIEDFESVPFFDYRTSPEEFSRYEFDTSEKALKELRRMASRYPSGYVHTHDSRRIGLSDIIYDKIHSTFLPPKTRDGFRVRMQLNTFYPTLKELVLLNHKRFRDTRPLVIERGSIAVPTFVLENYLNHEQTEYEDVFTTAKQKAKESIVSNTPRYLSAYNSLIRNFGKLSSNDFQRMVKDTGNVLERECQSEEELSRLELVNFVKGKIQELPLVLA